MQQSESTPRVTVAMSMHNASRFLRECIDSILAQSMPDFELLIADDGSTDSSLEVALSYADPRIRLIRCPHDFIASLNTLLGEARGRYIARMDADDVMLPDRLRLEADWLDSHPDIDAVCARAISIDEQGRTLSSPGAGAGREITPRIMAEGNAVCNPTAMVRRATLQRLGLGYEQAFCWAEDYRFWAELLRRGGRMVELPQPLIRYRHSPGQVTATRWDEMMEASSRIRADLIGRLVEQANPGYTAPRIPATGHELTLIIPFLNEGPEVARTVRSFMAHAAGRADVIVINDASYDSYPYMRELTAIPGVTYVLNRTRLGVAASRDKGVALCRTPYFLLLDAHMRAYDDSWLTAIPALLRENDRRILCCQTRCLMRAKSGKVIVNTSAPTAYGARFIFSSKHLMPGLDWVTSEHDAKSDTEPIQAVLGAAYASSTRYWTQLGGLRGLRQFGCDEQLISLKTWLDGGECRLVKKAIVGHIYRERMPYAVKPHMLMYNSLLISESLFPLKTRCLARAIAFTHDATIFQDAFNELIEYFKQSDHPKFHVDQNSFNKVIYRDRMANSPEPELAKAILARTPEIAQNIMSKHERGPGIFTGKYGQAIWLFLYGRKYSHTEATALAKFLITESADSLPDNDFTFATGLPGLGWAILLLIQDGYINHCEKLNEIKRSIRNYILHRTNDDYSFAKGWAGIIAYACAACLYSDPIISPKLDNIAEQTLTSKPDITAAFYCMLWLQVRSDLSKGNSTQSYITHSLGDWMKPSNFIASDPRFWNLSLYDGVLATSANLLTLSDYISLNP